MGGTVIGVLTALFFVVSYIIFMSADAARYRDAERIFGAARRPALARIGRLNTGIRRYYVVNASFGLMNSQ